MSNGVKSWSFSAWEQFDLCPAQYKYARIDKLPTADKAFFAKGRKAHTHLENVVQGKAALDPAIVQKERQVPLEIASLGFDCVVNVEQKWGFTSRWTRTDWGGAILRVVTDVMIDYRDGSAEVVDWKTGGKYGRSAEQMSLSAVATFHRFPEIETVATRLVYVEKGGQVIEDHYREDLPRMTALWEQRANAMFGEMQWLPRPNDRCYFCDFARSKGGPCRYG